jgi:hypothetical protein
MPNIWLIGISYSFSSKSSMRCWRTRNEEVVGELILIGEAGGGDGLKAAQEGPVGFLPLGDGGQ